MSSAKPKPLKVSKPSALRTPAVSGVYVSPLAGRLISRVVDDSNRYERAYKKSAKVGEFHEKQAKEVDQNSRGSSRGTVVTILAGTPRRINPYSISPERTLEILRKAHVITKAGRLTKVFK
jgi:hypothetical protein